MTYSVVGDARTCGVCFLVGVNEHAALLSKVAVNPQRGEQSKPLPLSLLQFTLIEQLTKCARLSTSKHCSEGNIAIAVDL